MNINERTENGVMVYKVEGRVDSAGAVDLDLALQSAVAENHYRLILDMADVNYINSAGLRTLADILTRAKEHGGDLKLVALNPKVSRVLQIVGFYNFFNIYDSVPNAMAEF